MLITHRAFVAVNIDMPMGCDPGVPGLLLVATGVIQVA